MKALEPRLLRIVDTTIRDNLRLARPQEPQASDDQLAAAAERARLLDWITSLPFGWDTPVGTTLLITHDLDGLDQVDEIVVLDHGRVAERGTHAELIRSGGAYQRLWEASR